MRTVINRAALIALRVKDGQSIAQLAHAAGIRQPTLSQIEGGRYGASEATRKRLASALNVPLSAIETQISDVPEPAAEDVAA
jgi:transcriptional regulator with XRE-family HTH domain